MLSAGPIPHNSILWHFTDFTGYVVFIITSFLPGVSLQTSVCSPLKFYPVFCGHNEYKVVFSIIKRLILRE